jgi:CHAT domain-containing protein/Tfp pilus assembly protein PilF
MKKNILIVLFVFISISSFAQISDTTIADEYFLKAKQYDNANNFDSSNLFYNKAGDKFLKLSKSSNIPPKLDSVLKNKYLDCRNNFCSNLIDQQLFDSALVILFKSINFGISKIGVKNLTIAQSYHLVGLIFGNLSQYDTSTYYYRKALQIRTDLLGEKHTYIAKTYNNIALNYTSKGEYDKALDCFFITLKIFKANLGEKHQYVSDCYNNIGNVYYYKTEFDKALEYYQRSFEISKEQNGELNISGANYYYNSGWIYFKKTEYNKALDFFFKSLKIYKAILGDKHSKIAEVYNGIGNVIAEQAEYDKALDYYLESSTIFKKELGEKNEYLADSYNNIGMVYDYLTDFDKALDYQFKCLELRRELLGDKHPDVAKSYGNIGTYYCEKKDYEKALEYLFKCLDILLPILGERNIDIAEAYNNIGNVYFDKSEYNNALEYYYKSLKIKSELYNSKHINFAISYNNIAKVYEKQLKFDVALKYYQEGLFSSLLDFNDTTNVFVVPVMKNYLGHYELLKSLQGKAQIFANKTLLKIGRFEGLELALRHYQACDTLIDLTNKKINRQSDKFLFSEQTNFIYSDAINVSLKLFQIKHSKEYLENAFNFSEKSKAQNLLKALSGAEAQKFSGIPDSLQEKEHSLKIDITFCENTIAEGLDSSNRAIFQSRLFNLNRTYDSLIVLFEKQYPEYYRLKYSTIPVTTKELRSFLDDKTAIISYILNDSITYIFTITRDTFFITQQNTIRDIEKSILYLRLGLMNPSSQVAKGYYRKNAWKFYKMLFPASLSENIKNLVIIPDKSLAMIPFEALLTSDPGKIKKPDDFNKYPYLLKKYNISYSYSASLFHHIFTKEKRDSIEWRNLNDWIGLAPVFSDTSYSGLTLRTREYLERSFPKTDTLAFAMRGKLMSENNISSLPGTENETRAIYDFYNKSHKSAQLRLHKDANEQFIKSGELSKYRIIHFATHGYVNSKKPEMSCLLLAQDSTSGEDGILSMGEIFNLNLNADLTVLSACETGLGKIVEGEGVIGLTRALLYAGSRNIVVSLWEVSDESTIQLMIEFYKNISQANKTGYSKLLSDAKRRMINDKTYSHPFYWSPFILIGK